MNAFLYSLWRTWADYAPAFVFYIALGLAPGVLWAPPHSIDYRVARVLAFAHTDAEILAEAERRWGLPAGLLDAILFVECSRGMTPETCDDTKRIAKGMFQIKPKTAKDAECRGDWRWNLRKGADCVGRVLEYAKRRDACRDDLEKRLSQYGGYGCKRNTAYNRKLEEAK